MSQVTESSFRHGTEITEAEIEELTWQQKSDLINGDPVTCVTHYDHRYRSFMKNVIRAPGGAFSPFKVSEFYSRYANNH